MQRHTRPVLTSLTLALALAGATAAHAEDSGVYATALLGLANQPDQRFDLRSPTPAQSREISLDSGLATGGALGWGFGNGWRVEGEFIYQSVDAGDLRFAAPGPQGEADNYASTSIALNLLYDVDLLGSENAKTYIGVGYANLTEIDIDVGPTSFSGDGDGFQLLFGARYSFWENAFVDAGVRWLDAGTVTLDAENGTGRIEADYSPWAFTVGVGWKF